MAKAARDGSAPTILEESPRCVGSVQLLEPDELPCHVRVLAVIEPDARIRSVINQKNGEFARRRVLLLREDALARMSEADHSNHGNSTGSN